MRDRSDECARLCATAEPKRKLTEKTLTEILSIEFLTFSPKNVGHARPPRPFGRLTATTVRFLGDRWATGPHSRTFAQCEQPIRTLYIYTALAAFNGSLFAKGPVTCSKNGAAFEERMRFFLKRGKTLTDADTHTHTNASTSKV